MKVHTILICALYSIKCGRLSFEGKTNLLTESYLDLGITNFSVVKGSRPRSCLVRQSTEAAMMSQRQSTSLRYPLKIGVAADSDNMMGHKGASWSYRRSASTKLHAWDEGHKIFIIIIDLRLCSQILNVPNDKETDVLFCLTERVTSLTPFILFIILHFHNVFMQMFWSLYRCYIPSSQTLWLSHTHSLYVSPLVSCLPLFLRHT
jgi:hypothetical protein